MSDVVNSQEEKDDTIIPGNAPLRPPEGTITAFHSPPCAVSPATSTACGEDSDDELIRCTQAQSPLPFGATDHDAAGNTTGNPASASWANDSSSSDGQRRTTTTRLSSWTWHSYQHVGDSRGPGVSTAWGDDSDDDDDGRSNNSHRDDDIERRPVTLSASSGLLMAAVAIDDDEEAPAVQRREEHADTAWGSDDDDEHVYDYRPPRFSQPFGMAAVAAAVAPTGTDMAPASHATTSWGCDGEDEDSSFKEESPPLSQSLRTGGGGACATATAGVNPQQPLSPARYFHHRHDSDEVVVAPLWVPHAQGQSGLGEPDDLWADEGDGSSGDTSRPRGHGNNPNRVVAGGLGGPGLSATLPALDDVDLTADDENNSPGAADLAATVPAGRIPTPLTMTPSPWFKASGRDFARQSSAGNAGSDADDNGRCNPHNLPSTSTPPRVGGGAWFGRWFTPNVPRRWRPPGAVAESSPMHEAPAAKYDFASKPQRPVTPPVRDRRRSWLQRPSAFVKRLRRRAVRELGPPMTPGGGLGAKQDDDGPGLRVWGWWDNFRKAPGLIGRLVVCILAVCALWSTSLSVVGENLASFLALRRTNGAVVVCSLQKKQYIA